MEEQNINQNQKPAIDGNAMLAAVFNSIHYTPTPKQRKIVSEILADEELIPLTKAHEICDYLKIERRHNRSIIKLAIENFR